MPIVTVAHISTPRCLLAKLLAPSPVVSHALTTPPPYGASHRRYHATFHLFRNAIRRLKAVGKLLAVLIARVVGQHLLARGALERLEACFALDGLCCGVLHHTHYVSHTTSHTTNMNVARRKERLRTAFS
ncbi:hypothetical protein FB567DRAFT_272228 [Paraphoma chrysanthemicola]|uniref:Uncharacterized protein n=1 Tax=Paraphoma chrysanthemicola TaxID=798071 RepID=A0A8K0RCF3_9PLEO|nr:hypothetical protein FB567DRAFT_272228 [Paraphoma chrysanthemicola]